jgi:hypothetical protein
MILESESGHSGISSETSTTKNGDVPVHTKGSRIALISNKLATVSQEQTIVFNTKVGIISRNIGRNMDNVKRDGLIDDFNVTTDGLIDDFNGWRKDQ